MSDKVRPVVLLILDGWGYREELANNAIASATKPCWDRLWKEYPHTLLRASESAVGLPSDQMGNSEVGHLNLGAGRVVYQEFSRVTNAVENGDFENNSTLLQGIEKAVESEKAIHILGLLSDGGVHSHESHIHAMVKMAIKQGAQRIYLHAFLDGRDTSPKSASAAIQAMENVFEEAGGGQFASVIGRYFAMDRDHRWQRIEAAYAMISHGESEYTAVSASEAVEKAYLRGESDEFVQATCIRSAGKPEIEIQDGDVVFFMNFRSDRARQITRPFIDKAFDNFDVGRRIALGDFITLTEYSADFDVPVAFPPERLANVFGEYIANLGMRQLRIAETEKYAHVTFFLNGGIEKPFIGEDRILVRSPDVATYDLQPQMSAFELTEKLISALEMKKYDVVICNFANPDMVGHTGNFAATVAAIEVVDKCLEQIVSCVRELDGELLITADHGNAELMRNEEAGQAHTAHTTNPVPFIYVGRDADLNNSGTLSDVTPTMLYLLGVEQPHEMSGHSLIEHK